MSGRNDENANFSLSGLYFDINNPARQDVMTVRLNEATVLADLNMEQTLSATQNSIFFDSTVFDIVIDMLSDNVTKDLSDE